MPNPIKHNLRIVSDGTAAGTKVFDAEDKPFAPHIRRIAWECDAQGSQIGTAVLTIDFVQLDVIGEWQEDNRT